MYMHDLYDSLNNETKLIIVINFLDDLCTGIMLYSFLHFATGPIFPHYICKVTSYTLRDIVKFSLLFMAHFTALTTCYCIGNF